MVDPAVHGECPISNVYPLVNAKQHTTSACLVKLTDSSLKQLRRASKTGAAGGLTLSLQQGTGAGTIAFQTGQTFSFTLNDLSKELGRSCVSALQFVAGADDSSGTFEALSKLTHRLQVQGTDDSYDQARVTAQKLAEEDQKKQGIPLNMKGMKANPTTSNAIVKQKAMQVQKPTHPPSASSAKPSSMPKPTSPTMARPTPLTNDISRKPLMQRLVHVLILKSSTRAKMLERIMNEGLSESDANIFDSTLKEISIAVSKDRPDDLVLKPSLYVMVDVDKWPAYDQWEKKVIKKKLNGGKTKSPPPSGGSQGANDSGANMEAKTSIVDRLIPFAPSRKRTQPMPQGQEPKLHVTGNENKSVHEKKIESPPQPPSPDDACAAELTPPPPQSNSPPAIETAKVSVVEDWGKEFPEIVSEESRDQYQAIFDKQYNEYCRCYEWVKKVADEFKHLEDRLNRVQEHSPEYLKVENEIVEKYNHYNGDENFTTARTKHKELRAKLSVIKERVKQWDMRPAPGRTLAPAPAIQNANLEDLTVM